VAAAWVDVLPVFDEAELERERRLTAAVERWNERGRRVARALPRALLGLWPLTAPDAAALRVMLEGPDGTRRSLSLDQFPLRIGRGDACALQLPHAAVSTEHAELRVERGQAFLLDLRSTNGTKRNGEPLVPLTPVHLQGGDRIGIGPFLLTVQGLGPSARTGAFEALVIDARPREFEGLFRTAHPKDRFLRVRVGGEALFLRVPAPWMRACWQRTSGLAGEDIGPMEEGAAQYVFDRVARTLGAEMGEEIELSAWLTPADAEREAQGEDLWLHCQVRLKSGETEFATTIDVPVSEVPEAPPFEAPADLQFPASVCVGVVRLRLGDLAQLEPGDALVPDAFFPRGFLDPGKAELGPAWLKLRSFWFGATLLRSEAGATLRLDKPWLRSPGEGWLMAEDDAIDRGSASLPLHELELGVQVELDRFPVTLGELERWRAGEVVSLRRGPQDPVRLVVETGLQRRVLAEGRVIVVNGKLAIEILRLVTRFEDLAPRST
jgi:pSer/pThr/pTyr-binding forkhead associated (FHA) protein/flagellar motor switch/type III secretory pathway protein FliN